MDMLPLPTNEFVNFDGKKKAEFVRDLHTTVRENIEKKNEHYARQANKSRTKVVFEPGDWVWIHLRKERFASRRKNKLQPRGDGPFQVLERINDNAYKIDLPSEYGNVSATFNVSDLSLYDAGDSRTNLFEEGGNDADQVMTQIKPNEKDQLQGIGGPMTRSRTKKMHEALCGLVEEIEMKESTQHQNKMIIMLSVEEDFDDMQVCQEHNFKSPSPLQDIDGAKEIGKYIQLSLNQTLIDEQDFNGRFDNLPDVIWKSCLHKNCS